MAASMWRHPRDPTIYGAMDFDITSALALVEQWRARTGLKISVMHLVCHAVAQAFAQHPHLNAKVRLWGKLERRRSVDLFVSVATEQGKDLSGARIDGADRLSVSDFVGAVDRLAGGIRSGQDKDFERSRGLFHRIPWWALRPLLWLIDLATNELHLHLPSLGMPRDAFGTAMITNVGMFGIDLAFAPFLPIGRCPLLVLISEVRDRPWVVDGKLEVRKVLRLCATFDHRIVDGFSAGVLAREVRRRLEHPRAEDFAPAAEAAGQVAAPAAA
jgi:pyruvate/2-oxoglutarate dehydrogenase complex dihydrolipoamide acyltransferase (E2) component